MLAHISIRSSFVDIKLREQRISESKYIVGWWWGLTVHSASRAEGGVSEGGLSGQGQACYH